MFNKKALLAAALLLGTAGGLVACGEEPATSIKDEFVQNESEFEGYTMYVIGSDWNSWNVATVNENAACTFTKSATKPNVFEITLEVTEAMVKAGCGFKFVASNSWTSQYGMEDINFEASNKGFTDQFKDGKYAFKEGTGNRSNISPKLAGTYHVEFHALDFTAEDKNQTTYTNKFVITYTA